MQHWIDKLEQYYEDIPAHLQPEVREFLDEYYEKKDTHSATSLDGLSDEELGELLYLELDKKDGTSITNLYKCTKLKVLNLNGFKSLSEHFFKKISDLKIFSLHSSNFDRVRECYKYFKNLLVLDISDNIPSTISPIDISHFRHLLVFSFKSATLFKESKLNHAILNQPNLIYIDLSGHSIQHFKSKNLNNLIHLNLSSNNLKQLSDEILKFKTLKFLDLSSNEIKHIPTQLFNLKELEYLDISYNSIENLSFQDFDLPNLNNFFFLNNPYKNSEILMELGSMVDGVFLENQMPVFNLLKEKYSKKQDDYNYFTLKIPKVLQTPMLQYISFFKDYVEATKGKDIIFEVRRAEEGLTLVTNGNVGVTLEELGEYFHEYVSLLGQDIDNWIPEFKVYKTAFQADIIRLKVERQITNLRQDLEVARLESKHLSKQLSDAEGQIEFLQNLSNTLSENIKFLVHGRTAETLDVDQLLLDIIGQIVKMQEGKYDFKLENLHNDLLTRFLREKGYTADHTRSGRSASGLQVGEIDIMIRKKDGTPFSIIEAFRLESCGEKNRIVAQHLDKLIHDYDTAGHERNFAVIYAEAQNFEKLWENYQTYVSELNGKPDFQAKYPLINFKENKEASQKSSIKIGVAKHRREGSIVEIYHIFVNMFA